MAKAKERLRHK